jgi:glutaminase
MAAKFGSSLYRGSASMNKIEKFSYPRDTIRRPSPSPALARFLKHCLTTYAADNSGAVADYIPELTTAKPAHFGISLATIDGHVYEVGDSTVEFTIQSISKAFVFALALELVGQERVEAKIGVEPSGEAFNSIRLTADNRPFNAMVNAGAIACTGLIHSVEGSGAFERVLDALSRFAGRKLAVDKAVFESERSTGDRNRAIGYMLRNYSVVQGNVDEVLDVYFRQCSILVTARDLAVMAGTLANRGVNPVTNERVITPYAVARALSVMTSSGMYDYAGEWIYRVGIPAKSGVGGGIIAALPGQFGLGTFSPPLDSHGNSVRGLKVCEELSSHFDLHVLNRSSDLRTSIIADYDIKGISSRRIRQPHEQVILDDHSQDIRVIELVGAMTFANVDYVSRQIATRPRPDLLIIDMRRVPAVTEGAAHLLADMVRDLASVNLTTVFSGIEKDSTIWKAIAATDAAANARRFDLADEAIEWAEDQLIYRNGGFSDGKDSSPLIRQALLAGLTEEELADLAAHATARTFHIGERIIATGEPASSIFFLLSRMVSVKLASGVRLASLSHGMVFGEMALIEQVRSAEVWADTAVTCLELSINQFEVFCGRHRHIGRRISQNLAALLAKRLIQANAKVDLLSAY